MTLLLDAFVACEGEDDLATAANFLDSLKVRGEAKKILLPIVASTVGHIFRHRVRWIEQAVQSQAVQSPVAGEERVSYQDFLRESFALYDGRRVRWADATIADHEQRISMLTSMRDGLNVTIARHQAAVDQLRKTGAPSLGALVGAAT